VPIKHLPALTDEARGIIRRSVSGIPQRVKAPGSLSWLDDFINVYWDRTKFSTDFDVRVYRHTGTKWYSDRENGANTNSGRATALTAPIQAGVEVTALPVAELPAAFPSGSKVVIATQDELGRWRSMVATLSAQATAAATSITVNAVTPGFTFPAGSVVANPVGTVFKAYSLAAPGDQLVPLDRSSNSFAGVIDRLAWGFGEMGLANVGSTSSPLATGAPITSIPTGLTAPLSAGASVTLESSGKLQTYVLAASAAAGATSISVVSQTPKFAFPAGTAIRAGNRIAKSITIAPLFPGELRLVAGDWHGPGGASRWTLKAGTTNVYTVTRSNTKRVVDFGVGQFGMDYKAVADAAACDTTPGSYYINGTEVGVHCIKGGEPDPGKIAVIIASDILTCRNENGDMQVYLEGFTIVGGGSTGNLYCENTGMGNLDLYAYNVNFLYASGAASTADSVNADGVRYAFLQRCNAAFSVKDGFNYASFDRANVQRNSPRFIEVDCESWGHGIGNPLPGFEDVNNASSAHTGSEGVRIGGKYHLCCGAVLADVQPGTETWNLECDVWGSLTASTTYSRAIDAQQAGATMHLWNVRAFDALHSIEARAGTTINIFNAQYESLVGTGTINQLTQLPGVTRESSWVESDLPGWHVLFDPPIPAEVDVEPEVE
jgi:hypothetical protein